MTSGPPAWELPVPAPVMALADGGPVRLVWVNELGGITFAIGAGLRAMHDALPVQGCPRRRRSLGGPGHRHLKHDLELRAKLGDSAARRLRRGHRPGPHRLLPHSVRPGPLNLRNSAPYSATPELRLDGRVTG